MANQRTNQGKNDRMRESHGPDSAINQAASAADEEPAFAISTPDAPPISEPDHPPRDAGANRAPADVLSDHLRCSQAGTVDADLARNFADDLVVLTAEGTYKGANGMRFLAEKLANELQNPRFTYRHVVVEGRMGLLEWSGEGDGGAYVDDGVDSYLIEDGRISYQTIHYTVKQR